MSSIIPGFAYDLFISYRHNDNRSGWVTDFVNALQEELAATIKEPLSIYFDKNPHDGLLETHQVDKSLEGKLKSLIFIPILSQTYCDPKSFAWRHEFVAYNKQVREDPFGRDIKLNNGNVASRILPIKIHDLDAEDKTTIENEIGGALRAIEFIYKTSGVNRPLTPADKKEDNANKTFYRDQINKAANAIKEIVAALKNPVTEAVPSGKPKRPAGLTRNRRVAVGALLAIAVSLSGYFIYNQWTAYNNPSDAEKSIAVLPFADLSEKKDQEYFSDGLTEELLDLLTRQKSLRVIGRTSSFAFKGKDEDLRTIGEKLGVHYLLEGSVRRSGNQLRITAQLIRSKDGSHVWSETFDREVKDVFEIYDEIASSLSKKLDITLNTVVGSRKSKQEVYDLVLQAKYLESQPSTKSQTRPLLERALQMDSADGRVWAGLAQYYATQAWQSLGATREQYTNMALVCAKKAGDLDNDLYEVHESLARVLRMRWDWQRAFDENELARKLNPASNSMINLSLGNVQRELEICSEVVACDPVSVDAWRNLAVAQMFAHQFERGRVTAMKGLKMSPDDVEIQGWIARSYLYEGKLDEALAEYQKIESAFGLALVYTLKNDQKSAALYFSKMSKVNIGGYARFYSMLNQPDKAFAYLDTAYRMRDPTFIHFKVDPFFDNIRSDARYEEMLKKLGLPLK